MIPLTVNIPGSGRAVFGPLPVGVVVESVSFCIEDSTAAAASVAVAFHRSMPPDTDAGFGAGEQAFRGGAQAWGTVVGFARLPSQAGVGAGWFEFFLHRVIALDSQYISVRYNRGGGGPSVSGSATLRLSVGQSAGASSEAPVPPPRRGRRARADATAPMTHEDLVRSVPRLAGESVGQILPPVPTLPAIPDVRQVGPPVGFDRAPGGKPVVRR